MEQLPQLKPCQKFIIISVTLFIPALVATFALGAAQNSALIFAFAVLAWGSALVHALLFSACKAEQAMAQSREEQILF
ncbi:MAG: hypothetical protein KBT88_06815 [Gammaproteobacteria bacterium]|nr:hypothetical protein [Gammaproteobacteria bacterium]MBQ0839482.1 hypothetical protein [Gammaproteobacteria bacterium]